MHHGCVALQKPMELMFFVVSPPSMEALNVEGRRAIYYPIN